MENSKVNSKLKKCINKVVSGYTEDILTATGCYFYWGEPEVPEKLRECYGINQDEEEKF